MKKQLLTSFITGIFLFYLQSIPILAVTEAEIEAVGKDKAAGGLFIWFLCAVAFLKVSQHIDSYIKGLGVNVGETGKSMISDMMVAAKGFSGVQKLAGLSGISAGLPLGGASLMSGGFSGIVGNRLIQGAVNSMTGQGGSTISQRMFESSLQKGGEFASQVTGAIAKGSISHTGSMSGPQAAQALSSYMGLTSDANAPTFDHVEIGGGRISGTETGIFHPESKDFAMYHADQYLAPEGNYETVTASDNSTWYKQYATDTVERTPYMASDGQIAYREELVKKLPDMPKRKDRV